MTDERPIKRRGPLLWLADRLSARSRRFWIDVALILVLYPLSIGPACEILNRYGDPAEAVWIYDRFYTPIIWICLRYPTAERFLDSYCHLWARTDLWYPRVYGIHEDSP